MSDVATIVKETKPPSNPVRDGILPDACRMLVIGDSHSRFWSGNDGILSGDLIPEISTYHIGSALAYNTRPGAKSSWSDRVVRYLDLVIKHGGVPEFLMFSFGEIDIRVHIVRRALAQGLSLSDAVAAVTENYLLFLDHMRRYDRQILVWGPPASQPDGKGHNPNVPVHGPALERNAATAMFHANIAQVAEDKSKRLALVSVLRETLLPNNDTRRLYYYDDNHLSQTAMPLAMAALERATGWRPRWQPLVNDPVIPVETLAPPREVNVAPAGAWRMLGANLLSDGNPIAADPLLRKPVRSPAQSDPCLMLDLRTTRTVTGVRITFANAADAADLEGIRLMISTDIRNYEPFAGPPPEVIDTLRVYRFDAMDFRALRIDRVGANVVLEVAGVEVIAKGYVAPA